MPYESKLTLASRVRAARLARGLSRDELSRRAQLSSAAVVQVESGRRSDSRLSTVTALADALGVSIDYLVGRSGVERNLLDHQALIYSSDDEFLGAVLPFIESGVRQAAPVLAVTSPRNMRLLRRALGRNASAVVLRSAPSWYGSPAAAFVAYQRFMIDSLNAGHGWVRVIGEPVWTGRTKREVEAWVRYEALLNLGFRSDAASFFCPYDSRELSPAVLAHARTTHPKLSVSGNATSSQDFVSAEDVLLR